MFFVLLIGIILVIPYGVKGAESTATSTETPKLTVMFFPLDDVSGDCCIIRYGDTQILIDAGATASAAPQIISKMNNALEHDRDKVWEYVIATHGDMDHIAAFSTDETYDKDTGVIHELRKSGVTFQNLIDFDTVKDGKNLHEATYRRDNSEDFTVYYKRYSERRKDGSFKKYKTASELCNGKAHDIKLDDDCTLTILYNKYYDEATSKANLISVCVLLTYKDTRFLFTGDLEKQGEQALIESNPTYFEEPVTVFKAGHHGSSTANTETFIDKIQPKYVVISAVAGDRYNFPRQEAMDHFLKYTKKIYITSMIDKNNKVVDYYGDITFTSTDGKEVSVATSSLTPDTLLTKTDWYIGNQTLEVRVFTLPSYMKAIGHCTLLKHLNTEILIDCGIRSENISYTNTMYYIDKVKQYCTDGVLEYVIVSNAFIESISNLIGTYDNNGAKGDGIFGSFKIKNIIGCEKTNIGETPKTSWWERYKAQLDELKTNETNVNSETDTDGDGVVEYVVIKDVLTISILNSNPTKEYAYDGDNSIVTVVNFKGQKLVFTGNITDDEGLESELTKKYSALLGNATFFLAGNSGDSRSNSEKLLEVISPEYTVVNNTENFEMGGRTYADSDTMRRLLNNTDKVDNIRNIYVTGTTGDITFTIRVDGETVEKSIVGSKSSTVWKSSNNN